MASHEIDVAQVRGESGFVGGMSAAMQTLENVVAEIALTNIPVLLVGESGTGKEMFAQRIHQLSSNVRSAAGENRLRVDEPAELCERTWVRSQWR